MFDLGSPSLRSPAWAGGLSAVIQDFFQLRLADHRAAANFGALQLLFAKPSLDCEFADAKLLGSFCDRQQALHPCPPRWRECDLICDPNKITLAKLTLYKSVHCAILSL